MLNLFKIVVDLNIEDFPASLLKIFSDPPPPLFHFGEKYPFLFKQLKSPKQIAKINKY